MHARVPEGVAAGTDAEKVDGNVQDGAGAAVRSRPMYSKGMYIQLQLPMYMPDSFNDAYQGVEKSRAA